MVAGKGRSGRGGSQIVRDGSSTERGGELPRRAGEDGGGEAAGEAPRRYRNYGLAALPAFAKRESERYRRGCASSPFVASSSSGLSSRECSPTALVVKMEVEAEPEPPRLPHFAPGDYLDDEQFKLLLPQLGVNTSLASGDFVAERELHTVVGLVARSSQQDADKADKWRHITVEQDRVFVDLVTDEE